MQERAGSPYQLILNLNRSLVRNASDVVRKDSGEWKMIYQGLLSSDGGMFDRGHPALYQKPRYEIFTRFHYRLWTISAMCYSFEGRLAYRDAMAHLELQRMAELAT